ncbi:MAG: InlB B-repeat-containing protein, partial [Clostridia bacterium]|nr:InlB B-repeat-containing protein [Clostridia bacterium]
MTAFGAGESLSLGDATDFDIDFNYYTNDPKKALSDLSGWKVSATNSSMPNAIKWVHVTSIDGLRNALTSTSKDNRYIVIDKDIIVRYGHTKWDTISIKSDKVIDLNGHSIVLHYNRNKYDTHSWKVDECYGQSHESADFKSVMFDITNSTTNIIDTSKDKTGLIYTDAYMINPFENSIDRYTTRDIFTVSNGGNLVVYGGTFQAGRSKQQSSEKKWDKIKTAIGSAVNLATSIAGYATGINGATGALKDANINAETAFKNLQAGNNSGQTDRPENNSDEGGTQKKTGANSVEENKQQTPQNEVATLNQTIGQKQELKNSGASASAPARRNAPAKAGENSGQTGGQTGGQQGQQGQNGQNNANAQGSAKYTGNSDIAKAKNEVINKATDSTAINGMVNAAFDMVDKIGAIFSTDSNSIVTQSFLGTAVTVGGGGTFVSYGGKFIGYGMTPNTRNAVIECTKNGRCYIYGGTFEGYCGANIFNIVQATNSAFTSKQWIKDESGKVTTKDIKVEVSESGGYKELYLEPDSTDENIKLVDTSCVQVRGGTFRCYYEYSMVGLHDGGEMTKFPGTSGSVNLGTTSFNEDFIRDGRIQVNDNYGDGALVLMDDKLTDNTIHHYRLFCGDDELRYKQYLTVSPLNGGSNSSYSLSLIDRYNNKNSGVLSKAFGMADDEDNERGVYSNDELCFNFEINSKDTGNYYVVPNLTNTDVRAENLDESEVWYYQTPTSSTGQKLNTLIFGYNNITIDGILKSSGNNYHLSTFNRSVADYPNALLRQFSSTSSVKYEDYTKNYFNTLKWFTYNVYKVDPLTRENIGEPIITTVYGASNDSIKCRLPLADLGINYQAGEMYRVEFSVSEYAQFGWGLDNERYEGTTSLDTATAKSSIVFLCHDKDELITKENGNGKTVEFTPLQWVDEPQPGKTATVKLVNGGAGLIDWTKRKIFDVYYQWFAVDSEGHTTMIAGTDNIYRNKTFVDPVQGDYADHRFSRFTPDTDQFNYANTIDPKHPLNTELDENNLPVDTDKWTNELVHAYLANTTERETLALDKSSALSLKNNDRTYSASDSCYIPEEYSDCQFYVKCIAVNMNWQTIYDFVQTFSTHYTGVDSSKVTVRYDANGVESSELDSYKIKQYGSVKTTIIDGSFMNKTGYVFAGWSKDKTNQTVDYTPGQEVTFTESTTLYAVWKKGINVKFVSSLGNDIGKELVDGSYVSKTYREYNTYSFEEITVPGNGYVTDNYRLSGWSSNGYGTTAEYMPGDVIHPTTDMTLYAVWGKKNPVINFDANGGSFPDEEYAQPQEVIYGQRARIKRFNTTDIMPVKDYCEFIGWSEDANATAATYSPAGAYTATYLKKDITLYAVWKAAPDKVNALNVSGIETPVLGQSISITTNPVVSDSRFSATVTKWEEVDAAVNKDITKATVITDEISPNANSFYKVYVDVTPNDTGSTQLVYGPLSINGVRTDIDFRINGNDARLEEKGEDGKFTFSCIFAPTIPNNYITEINIISSGTISLSADQSLSTVGAKFTVPSTANYTRSGNVSWKTSTVFNGTFSGVSTGNFVYNNYYKAVITLNAKSGYKFYENCKVASVPYFEGGVVEHISDTQVRVTTYQKKSIGYVISNVAADGFAPQYIGTAFNKTDLTVDNAHCKVAMGTTATSFDGSTGDLNDCDHYVNVDESGILTYRWVRIPVTVTADIGYVVNDTTTITVPGAKSVEYVSSKTGSSSTKYSVTYDVIFEAKEIPSSNIINSLSISGVPTAYTDGDFLDYDFGVISNTDGVTISKAETGKLYQEMYGSYYSATKPFSFYPGEILVLRLDVTHSKDTTFGKSVGEEFNVSLVKGVETIENEDGTTQSNLVTYDTIGTIEKITGNTARIAVEIYQDCFKTPDIIANISYDLTGRIYPACAETSPYGQITETGYRYNKIDNFYTMPKAVTETAKDFSYKLNGRSISIVDPETHECPDELEIGKSYAIRVDFNYMYPVSEDALFDFGNEYGISKVILTTADSRFCQYSGYAVSAPVFKYEAHAGTIENQSAKFKKADATCNSPAEYYYECELCHEKTSETYTVGVALDHNSNGVVSYNEKQHYTTCTRCDEPINPQYHTFTSSKLSDGRTKYTCECGYSYTLGEPYTAAKSLTL